MAFPIIKNFSPSNKELTDVLISLNEANFKLQLSIAEKISGPLDVAEIELAIGMVAEAVVATIIKATIDSGARTIKMVIDEEGIWVYWDGGIMEDQDIEYLVW